MQTDKKKKDWKAEIQAGVNKLRTQDNWVKYLKTQAAFYDYSFGNCVLIFSQRPTATRVAGYQSWKKLGRQVQKGAKSIKILAPMMKKKKTREEQDSLFFRAVSVFDVADTEGDDLPRMTLDCVKAENPESLLWRLQRFAQDDSVPVTFEKDTGAALGYYSPSEHRIVVNADISPIKQTTTLAHELAHSILHRKDDEVAKEHSNSFKELEAESVAYIVATHFGFKMGDNSFGYILGYNSNKDEFEKHLKTSGERIARCAKLIIGEVRKDA